MGPAYTIAEGLMGPAYIIVSFNFQSGTIDVLENICTYGSKHSSLGPVIC